MSQSDPIQRLIQRLARLPGIGEKTATRLAFHILRAPEPQARELAQSIVEVREKIRLCSVCCNRTEADPGPVCTDPRRDGHVICVVAQPTDLMAVDRSGHYRGRYHVLHGVLSPLDGIGPDDLPVKELEGRVQRDGVIEVILATNPNLEGNATAMYVAAVLKPLGVKVSRLASGLPVGGDLEYADEVTLSQALEGRREM